MVNQKYKVLSGTMMKRSANSGYDFEYFAMLWIVYFLYFDAVIVYMFLLVHRS